MTPLRTTGTAMMLAEVGLIPPELNDTRKIRLRHKEGPLRNGQLMIGFVSMSLPAVSLFRLWDVSDNCAGENAVLTQQKAKAAGTLINCSFRKQADGRKAEQVFSPYSSDCYYGGSVRTDLLKTDPLIGPAGFPLNDTIKRSEPVGSVYMAITEHCAVDNQLSDSVEQTVRLVNRSCLGQSVECIEYLSAIMEAMPVCVYMRVGNRPGSDKTRQRWQSAVWLDMTRTIAQAEKLMNKGIDCMEVLADLLTLKEERMERPSFAGLTNILNKQQRTTA